ncbi:MAG: urate oxidase, partial [Acidocella sp.]|nr:urate oxidase [Acidocella sp.]
MHLASFTYGKGRVRLMRVARTTPRHEIRELSLEIMLDGDFAASFTSDDNTKVIATDSIKNIANALARQHPALENEPFLATIATYFLDHYRQISRVSIIAHETAWDRLMVDGTPHDHAFVKAANGQPGALLTANRAGTEIRSGITGFTCLKTTQSGWTGYVIDGMTTLPETTDRIFSTAMNVHWTWQATPSSYATANRAIIAAMMTMFATTYSPSVQHSLYLMGSAALAAVPPP